MLFGCFRLEEVGEAVVDLGERCVFCGCLRTQKTGIVIGNGPLTRQDRCDRPIVGGVALLDSELFFLFLKVDQLGLGSSLRFILLILFHL